MEHSLQSRQAQYITVDGQSLVIFSSNDYLGLSHRPEVIKKSTEAIDRFGCGTGGAPGTSGTTSLHVRLANEIARFKQREKGYVFPSGYAANIALHQSLSDKDTIFFSDERNHPSIGDGIKLSGCPQRIYRHIDVDHLEKLLKETDCRHKIVTTCSVFTLDGAVCPLDEFVKFKYKYQFTLILDEAHATGCIGKTGRGLEELYSLEGAADFIMGAFSKALGSQGGFLTFSKEAEKKLKNPLRAYKYSTSISAPSVAASLASLSILEREPELVVKMRANVKRLYDVFNRQDFQLNGPDRHIINIYFETQKTTMRVIDRLRNKGYFVVPVNVKNRWGLRITAMAVHTEDEIDDFCKSLFEIKNEV